MDNKVDNKKIGKAYNPVEEALERVGHRLDRLYGRVDSIDIAINKSRMFYIDRLFDFSKHIAELDKKINATNEVNKILHQMLRDKEAEGKSCATCKYYLDADGVLFNPCEHPSVIGGTLRIETTRKHVCNSWTAEEE